MKEEIGQILEQLKLKNLSVAKVEKALEYSNGTLGKARDGKINLPVEKMEKLRAYAKVHLETLPLDGQIMAMSPAFDIEKIQARINELEWVKKVEEWCSVKGFPPSELLEKFEGFERRIKYYAESKIEIEQLYGEAVEELIKLKANLNFDVPSELINAYAGQNKPQISIETGLSVNPSKNQKKAKEGAENKPLELSPFLKARQNLKNGIKNQ